MKHTAPELVTQESLDELHRISPNDPDHMPREIKLIETFRCVILAHLGNGASLAIVPHTRTWHGQRKMEFRPCDETLLSAGSAFGGRCPP
jgi:acetate kinase